ncbi:MAG TPA: hypothetical protein PK411_00090 [Mesotoga infera]|nr:hypothetical protein [Mesotoga sp.]NLI05627.1 hypothetical protein [Thermotogaceae bacterium]HNS67771.1 hypothetical protein [Mesotoga infera]HOI35117.1 hypothetical protein [Mesotoga infera]HON28348.1 hypothetical protein [Mesotoga infera]
MLNKRVTSRWLWLAFVDLMILLYMFKFYNMDRIVIVGEPKECKNSC